MEEMGELVVLESPPQQLEANALQDAETQAPWLLSVGRFGSGRGSVFWCSWYSMGSLRSEAFHNSWVEGLGGGRQPCPQEMQGGSEGGLRKIDYLMSVSARLGICFGWAGFTYKNENSLLKDIPREP
jgi:hypothetical protein